MKFRRFILPFVNVLFFFVAVIRVDACGPFFPIIPTPDYFKSRGGGKLMADYEREENLKLWQSATSRRIPLSDIEEAVYKDSWEDFYHKLNAPDVRCDNLFYAYLKKARDFETIDFLNNAKLMSESWQREKSPWYYPTDCMYDEDYVDWDMYLDLFAGYKGGILEERYALQSTRALFAARRWGDCILYADSAFRKVPDTSLMKRMATRYVAGCWKRTGMVDKADSLYAKAGDIWSVSPDKRIELMVNLNPDAHLDRDPFTCYPTRWTTITYDYSYFEPYDVDHQAMDHANGSNPRGKLKFARRMLGYQKDMRHGKTGDDRGIARLMYAIGRRNSFEECWALTQYWRGFAGLFYPDLDYWDDGNFAANKYDFLYDYQTGQHYKATEELYDSEVDAAVAMLRSDEAKARAYYILGNLKTIVRDYGDTPTASFVKTSCDNWKHWL